MKASELRKKSDQDLTKMAGELQEKARLLRFDLPIGKVKNVKELRSVKRDIARILTARKERAKNL